MKRLLAYAMALTMLFAVGTVNAQKASKKTKAKAEKTTEKKAKAETDNAHLTKSGKLDKRFKENKEAEKKEAKAAKAEEKKSAKKAAEETKASTAAAASESKATASRAKATASKTADQVDNGSKGPHGETVYTGPRGGKYFINKNGKKEYLSSLKKH